MKQIPAIRNAKAGSVRARVALHRVPADGHSFKGTLPLLNNHALLRRPAGILQTKLIIGKPNDQFEQEAESVAERVMRTPGTLAPSNHNLQRKCACGGTPGPGGECEECRKKRLQRNVAQPSTLNHLHSSVPPIVHEVLRSRGQPLDRMGEATCRPSAGVVETIVYREHCVGDCVFQHETQHAEDYGYCCERYSLCMEAPDFDERAKCYPAWDDYMKRIDDWTQCNAYNREGQCLTSLLSTHCTVGGGKVSEECCTSLQKELDTVTTKATEHCAKAVPSPCPFTEEGKIISI